MSPLSNPGAYINNATYTPAKHSTVTHFVTDGMFGDKWHIVLSTDPRHAVYLGAMIP